MMNQRLVIASEIDKSNLCENVYQNNIVNPYEFLKSCENYLKIVHAKIPDGCYTNFRDALFHFWKLSRTYEWNELNCQAFAVCEHANRAKTDASLMLLRRSAMILDHILTDYNFDEYITAELISKHDSIWNMEMYIRLGGMMLENLLFLYASTADIFVLVPCRPHPCKMRLRCKGGLCSG